MPKSVGPKTIGLLNSYTLTTAAGAYSIAVKNRYGASAYMSIVTEDEAATASLTWAISAGMGAGANMGLVSAPTTPITTNTTTRYLIGNVAESGQPSGVTESFFAPLPENFFITLTVSGGGASFGITLALAIF